MTINTSTKTSVPMVLAGSLWTIAMMLTVAALLNQDKFFVERDSPIASVVQIQRDVSYRNETDLAWTDASENQGFFEGDRISTGAASTATLSFNQEMFVVVGPDSTISVSTISQRDGLSYVVNIMKGAVKPIVSSKSTNKLIVSSGAKSFNIEPGSAVGFQKSATGAIQGFSSRERFPVQASKSSNQVVKSVSVSSEFKAAVSKLVPIKIETASLSVKGNPFKPLNTEKMENQLELLNKKKVFIDPTLDKLALDSWKKIDLKVNFERPFESKTTAKKDAASLPSQSLSSKPLLLDRNLPEAIPDDEPKTSKQLASVKEAGEKLALSKKPVVKPPNLKLLNAGLAPKGRNVDKQVSFKKAELASKPLIRKVYQDSELIPIGVINRLAKTNFSTRRFAESGSIEFDVEIKKPSSAPPGWTGGMEFKTDGVGWTRVPMAESTQKVVLDSSSIKSWNFDRSRQANCSTLITRFYGSEISSGKIAYSAEQRSASLCSYGEFEGLLPARVSIQNLTKPSNLGGFYEPKYGPTVEARFSVKVTRTEDFLALLPFVRGDQSGGVQFNVKMSDQGVFGVASTGIVSEYLGDFRQPALSDRLRGLLGHSVVFQGKQSAVQSSKGMSAADLQALIEKSSDSGGKVYLRSKATLVPISRDFLKQSQEVAKFVKGTSPILYLEKVSILSFK